MPERKHPEAWKKSDAVAKPGLNHQNGMTQHTTVGSTLKEGVAIFMKFKQCDPMHNILSCPVHEITLRPDQCHPHHVTRQQHAATPKEDDPGKSKIHPGPLQVGWRPSLVGWRPSLLTGANQRCWAGQQAPSSKPPRCCHRGASLPDEFKHSRAAQLPYNTKNGTTATPYLARCLVASLKPMSHIIGYYTQRTRRSQLPLYDMTITNGNNWILWDRSALKPLQALKASASAGLISKDHITPGIRQVHVHLPDLARHVFKARTSQSRSKCDFGRKTSGFFGNGKPPERSCWK